MSFKYSVTPGGDAIVEKDIEKIKKVVEGKSFDNLTLFGSFGRGEGLVLEGVPRNDYDLLLVGGDRKLRKALERIKVGCIPEVWHIKPKDVKEATCTQQWFSVRYASQLLAGNPLDLPDWQPWDIPFEDAIYSLERRTVSMLVGKWEMGKEKPDLRKITEQIAKGIIAVGDATLIKRGQFHPKYSVRALMLSQDSIGDHYQLAVSMKLLGWPELGKDGLWQLWHDTREMIRDYVVKNQIRLQTGEILFNITDRTPRENLRQIIEGLRAEQWL